VCFVVSVFVRFRRWNTMLNLLLHTQQIHDIETFYTTRHWRLNDTEQLAKLYCVWFHFRQNWLLSVLPFKLIRPMASLFLLVKSLHIWWKMRWNLQMRGRSASQQGNWRTIFTDGNPTLPNVLAIPLGGRLAGLFCLIPQQLWLAILQRQKQHPTLRFL
jgi:hypothetical protein